jgi:hypothetical protein
MDVRTRPGDGGQWRAAALDSELAGNGRNRAPGHGTRRIKHENEDKELVKLPRDNKRRAD